MEKSQDTDKLIAELKGMIERMQDIGNAARDLIVTVEHNSDMLNAEGGKEGMYMRHCNLAKTAPELHESIKDEYSKTVIETMKSVVMASVILTEMTEQFMQIPDEKQKFAAKMN